MVTFPTVTILQNDVRFKTVIIETLGYMKKAIIIGATSGIGRALATKLNERRYMVGITGRRVALLEEVQAHLSENTETEPMDVTEPEIARQKFNTLVERLGSVDLVILSAGVGYTDESNSWPHIQKTVETNALGFAAIADAAFRQFEKAKGGHLVGITSVAAVRENGAAPAYHASKSFASCYLAGLRHRAVRSELPIKITDIRPGFVDTAMAKGDGLFWVATPEKAASQILRAIERDRHTAYITRRWRGVASLLKVLPDWLYHRII